MMQQKEALENEVLEAQSAPALADAARNLGMIPSKDTAHLIQDPTGNWIVVGKPKPAEGAPPPPLNPTLPVEMPPAPPAAPAPKPGSSVEVPRRVGASALPGMPAAPGGEVPVRVSQLPGSQSPVSQPPGLQLVPLPMPAADTLVTALPALVAPAAPTVAAVPDVAPVVPVVSPPVTAVGVPSQ